jgi:hypothetical protein
MMKYLLIISLILFITCNEKRLIKFDENNTKWLTEEEVLKLSSFTTKDGKEIHFMDITDTQDLEKGQVPKVSEIPERLTQQVFFFL